MTDWRIRSCIKGFWPDKMNSSGEYPSFNWTDTTISSTGSLDNTTSPSGNDTLKGTDLVTQTLNLNDGFASTSYRNSSTDDGVSLYVHQMVTTSVTTTTRHPREPDFLSGWLTYSHDLPHVNTNYNMYILYATFGVMVLGFLMMVCWIQYKRRWLLRRYERLPAMNEGKSEFVYKPSDCEVLDDAYENTFVGVTVPILHEVTKIWAPETNFQGI